MVIKIRTWRGCSLLLCSFSRIIISFPRQSWNLAQFATRHEFATTVPVGTLSQDCHSCSSRDSQLVRLMIILSLLCCVIPKAEKARQLAWSFHVNSRLASLCSVTQACVVFISRSYHHIRRVIKNNDNRLLKSLVRSFEIPLAFLLDLPWARFSYSIKILVYHISINKSMLCETSW